MTNDIGGRGALCKKYFTQLIFSLRNFKQKINFFCNINFNLN